MRVAIDDAGCGLSTVTGVRKDGVTTLYVWFPELAATGVSWTRLPPGMIPHCQQDKVDQTLSAPPNTLDQCFGGPALICLWPPFPVH
ncbi:hypothetical protein K435DRAFT_880404 [Dendrothele bispora CBS 962.96]|uniref:Uncharacterized protein n=1 Tax=Dendrothele bispora (strain CBS 962.96) TaxID=1314807 RepID=A0A4S8KJH2_DENBC|nr:hypothetical protein K435DRAFT_880404 [Dendrothele bispora CBS 962.96]